MVAFTPINPQLGWQLSFLGTRWGQALLPAGVQTAQGEERQPAGGFRSLSPLLCLWVLLPFPSLPDSTASTLKSHLALSSLTGRVPLAQESVSPPPQSNVPCHRGLCRAGGGLGCGFPAQLAFEVSQKPLSGLPPSHTLFLFGLFFPVQDPPRPNQGWDWQCLLPCPFHLGKLSGAGGGGSESLCGVQSLPPPQPGLNSGFPLSTPPWRCRDPTASLFPVTGSPVSAAGRGACASAHPASLPKAMSQSHWPPRSQSTRPGSP